MILITIKRSATVVCNSYLLKPFTLIKVLFYLINRFCVPCFFFDFLIPLTTETTDNSYLFQFISSLFKFLQWCYPKRELRIASGVFLALAYLRNFSSYFVVFFYRSHMYRHTLKSHHTL